MVDHRHVRPKVQSGSALAAHIEETSASLAVAARVGSDRDAAKREIANRSIVDSDRRLAQCRKLLDAGGDPKTVADWMAEIRKDRQAAELALRSLAPCQTVSADDMRRLIEGVEDVGEMLSQADPEAKTALYADLGVQLTYDPRRKVMTVESRPESWALDRVGGRTTTITTPPAWAMKWAA